MGEVSPTAAAELTPRIELCPATWTIGRKRSPTLIAELPPLGILLLALRAFHGLPMNRLRNVGGPPLGTAIYMARLARVKAGGDLVSFVGRRLLTTILT